MSAYAPASAAVSAVAVLAAASDSRAAVLFNVITLAGYFSTAAAASRYQQCQSVSTKTAGLAVRSHLGKDHKMLTGKCALVITANKQRHHAVLSVWCQWR